MARVATIRGRSRPATSPRMLADMPAGLSAGQVLAEARSRLEAAHAWLRAEAQRRGSGVVIASTAIVVLARNDHFACLWAGDSRAYLLRQRTMVQISRDHSLVQELVDCGALPAADAEAHPHANVITRAVGADIGAFELDKRSGELLAGDRMLLCSDGLCKTLPDAEIAAHPGRRRGRAGRTPGAGRAGRAGERQHHRRRRSR